MIEGITGLGFMGLGFMGLGFLMCWDFKLVV